MAMDLAFVTADVFTETQFGGNPLAVFPDAEGLDGATMQRIASELNLSETVFVLPPTSPGALARLRIFTPAMELPFAGHPTVGTATLLADLDRIPGLAAAGSTEIVLDEAVGAVAVSVTRTPGRASQAVLTSPRNPERLDPAPEDATLAALLGLPVSALADRPLRPAVFSAGVPFVIVPVRDLDALAAVRLDRDTWQRHFAGTQAQHVYVVALGGALPPGQVRVRMFAPAMGIVEDPATGAAAAALAGWLGAQTGSHQPRQWQIDQGIEMGRPSRILLDYTIVDGRATRVRVGGAAVPVSRGTLTLRG